MFQPRFGELLGKMVPISSLDVEEILTEQTGNHRRFGDIALSWGLCQPKHVLSAWCDQLVAREQQVDLDAMGVDAQAAQLIDSATAIRLNAMPIRCLDEQLVVAVVDCGSDEMSAELESITGKKIVLVSSDSRQLARVIRTHYSTDSVAA